MKKYWKIEGQDRLWTLKTETPHHWWFTQGERGWLLSKVASPACKVRPASFEEIHGRPKPPAAIWADAAGRGTYEKENPKVALVFRARRKDEWWVALGGQDRKWFPTYAEAIAHAHDIALGERSQPVDALPQVARKLQDIATRLAPLGAVAPVEIAEIRKASSRLIDLSTQPDSCGQTAHGKEVISDG